MNYNKILFAIIAILSSLFLFTSADMMIQEIAAVGLFIYFLLNFIDSIGKSYNLLDIPILLALFQCMLMPSIVYGVYNKDALVVALRYDMGIPAEVYFGYMFPAILALIAGIKLPELFQRGYHEKFIKAIQAIRKYMVGKGNMGILLMAIGFVTGFMQIFVPGDLKYIAYLFSKLLYVGILYVYFSDFKSRALYLGLGVVSILAQSIAGAMFGELIYILALGLMLVLLGKKVGNLLKFGIASFGLIMILLIQSIKGDYRAAIWNGQSDQGNSETFFSLLSDRLASPERFFDLTMMFPTVVRFNQGMIVSKVMDFIPNRAPFADGETIFTTLAASFVPRILWPDKPISGGKMNMERFTGFIIEGYSMNIGPMGEAYGNFGVGGGIVFMFFYGLFFSLTIYFLLRAIRKRPTILLWFPVLFLNSIQMETDILMCVNSLIKNLIFIWFCYWAGEKFLRLKL